MNDDQPGRPCPQCQQKLILQYSKEDPRITNSLDGKKIRIPMRCTRCGINIQVSLDPKELQDADPDLEADAVLPRGIDE